MARGVERRQMNRGSRCAWVVVAGSVVAYCAVAVTVVAGGAQAKNLPDVSGIPTANPVAYAPASIAKGKNTFIRLCAECHDEDGKALAQTLAPAADLTDPSRWKYGTTDAHLFRSIRDGAGAAMPVFGNQLSSDAIWEIVNFIRSIGPATMQPNRKP
jgi:mono/diheme cytochrome c family protein